MLSVLLFFVREILCTKKEINVIFKGAKNIFSLKRKGKKE